MNLEAVATIAAAVVAQMMSTPVAAETVAAEGLLVLPAGSGIELMVLREVDSDRAVPGDPLRLRVNSPVMVGETVVIPVGASAQGEVTATRKSGGLLRRGNISVNITAITLGDRSIPLGISLQQDARGGKSDDFLKMSMAPMWILFARGNSARLKAGELLSAEVEQDICFAPEPAGYLPVPCSGDLRPDDSTTPEQETAET